MSLDLERVREALEQHRDGEAGTHQYDDLAWAARLWLAGLEKRLPMYAESGGKTWYVAGEGDPLEGWLWPEDSE